MRQALSIVNSARRIIGLSDLSSADFDTGIQRDHVQARELFNQAYRELINKSGEDFRYTFSFQTVANQQSYNLPVPVDYLASNDLYRIDAAETEDYQLKYYTEDEARLLYPDFSDIPSGKIQGYFLTPGTIPNTRELRFLPTPDSAYTILAFAQVQPESLTSVMSTTCGNQGDEYLQAYMSYKLALLRGFGSSVALLQEMKSKWYDYLGTNLQSNNPNSYMPAYLHLPLLGASGQ